VDSENPPRTACSWCLMDVNSREILDRGDKLYAWRIYELLALADSPRARWLTGRHYSEVKFDNYVKVQKTVIVEEN